MDGSNRDGWFTNEDLVKQFENCVDFFKELHPNQDLVIAFDNSMTHRAKAPDGLDASAMNLKDGGKHTRATRNGWFIQKQVVNGVETEVRVEQSMHLPDGSNKGLKTVLTERRGKLMDDNNQPLRRIRADCKAGKLT
jgi:hypothetical protein